MTYIKFVFSLLLILLISDEVYAINAVIVNEGNNTHLELSGAKNWNYSIEKKVDGTAELLIENLDPKSIQSLESFKSDLVKEIKVNTKSLDGKVAIVFSLQTVDIDYFEYQTDQPSRLIVDFFKNENQKDIQQAISKATSSKPTITESEQSKTKPSVTEKKKISKTTLVKNKLVKNSKTVRNPANDTLIINPQGPLIADANQAKQYGVFDSNDPNFERFSIKDYEVKEDSILRSKENYYIPFPMLEPEMNFWENIKNAPIAYNILPKDTEENKQARLLLTLFQKKRINVFLKVIDWFREKYPESEYSEITEYMNADIHLEMWKNNKQNIAEFDKAIQKYKEVLKRFPNSPLAERTSLKLGYLNMERGDYMLALRLFQEHIENKALPEKALSKELAKIGQALSYSQLKKFNESISTFKELLDNGLNQELKAEAAFRIGDVLFKQKKYNEAITSYNQAKEKFSAIKEKYPNAAFNAAEAEFWLDKKMESFNLFKKFIIDYPNNSHTPFAMTRIGELLDIFGADHNKVMGAYLETFFRFGENTSAIIARIHMISEQMRNMKQRESEHAVDQILSLAKKLDIPDIEQFATIMISEGYNYRGEFDKSIFLLEKYYKSNPLSVNKEQFTRRLITNINDKIKHQMANQKYVDLLKTYNQYTETWLKNSKRLDTKFYVGQAFENLGSAKSADMYYQSVLNQVYAIKDTQLAKELKAIGALPTEEELNLRLAASAAKQDKHNKVYDYLKNIKHPEVLTEQEQIERINLAVTVFENRDEVDVASRYLTELIRTWRGKPHLVSEPYFKLAQFELKQNKTSDAIQSLEKIDNLMTDSKQVNPILHMKSLKLLGDTYLKIKNIKNAETTYEKLLSLYEDKVPLASTRYTLGEIYYNKGEKQKAAEVWNSFKGKNSESWSKLAKEQLKHADWMDNYKQYISRIPAMADSKSKEDTSSATNSKGADSGQPNNTNNQGAK